MKELKNEKCLYFLKDKKLNDVVGAFLLRDHEVAQHFGELANDVKSPFYGRQFDFVIYKKGVLNDDNFEIDESDNCFVHLLSEYMDDERIQMQWVVQTLNYCPAGYFKMPKEKLQAIEEDINKAVQKYVEIVIREHDEETLIKRYGKKAETN